MCETKCLICPKLDFKNIYILIFVLTSLFRRLIPKIIQKLDNNDNKPPNTVIYYFDIVSNFFSYIISSFLIIKDKLKKGYNKEQITTSEGEKTIKNMRRFFFIIIPLIALTDFLGQLCLYFFYRIQSNKSEIDKYISQEDLFFIIFFDISFRYIFSRILLKSYFYKHHYLSMILTFIGSIPLLIIAMKNIFEIENISEKKDSIIIFIFLYLIRALLFSLEDVFNKIALNKLLLRPYQLMFYKSLFEMIPIIGLSVPEIIKDFDDFKKIYNNLLGFLLYRGVYIIFGFFLFFAYISIIELVNPNHLSILKSLEFIAFYINNTIWDFIEKEKNDIKYFNYIFEFISCIILLFAALLHNEMIIIKKCGLYECTDYYKTEVKGFSNIDVDFDADKTLTNNDETEDLKIANDSINDN